MLYAQLEDCITEIPALTEGGDNRDRIQGTVLQSLYEASRQFETELKVYEDFFAPATGALSLRAYIGEGTDFLPIHPNQHIESVFHGIADSILNLSIGTKITNWVYNGRYLKFLGANHLTNCWIKNEHYIIIADWGFPKCVPASVTVAVKSLAILKWLSNPKNRIGIEGDLDENLEARLRADYNRILNSWHGQLAYIQIGVA